MDRYERTLNVVTDLNSFNNGDLEDYKLLSSVCEYFDFIKNEELDDADKRFLIYLSNKAGIPHYYDILTNFNKQNSLQIDDENIGLRLYHHYSMNQHFIRTTTQNYINIKKKY